MAKIPTPIPRHVVAMVRGFFGARSFLLIYRLLLIFALGGLLVAAVSSPSVILTFFALTVIGFFIVDDIEKIVANIWNLNFWYWRVD